MDGVARHLVDDDAYPMCAGDVYVINDGRAHGYRNTQGVRLINLMSKESEVLARVPSLGKVPGYQAVFHLEPRFRSRHPFGNRLRLGPGEMAHLVGLLESLERELEEKSEGYEAMALAVYQQIVISLCRCFLVIPFPERRELASIGKAVSYLENNFTEDVELKTLEELTHLSPRTFLRQFKSATGITPIQYLLRVRVARAAKLLKETSLNISEIAFRVGFNDSNYFSKQFKKILGHNPKVFRAGLGTKQA